ncbi:hypothetical protein PUN28_004200 [Cardiocondyla obscurior]|uniref:Ninjurin-1 n=1 Tax=Cardiocondyla obscurior TaxID=286306 RepID=A0AAW2GPZ8_9HYME
MNDKKQSDEILYLDEVNDEVSKPLTSTLEEAAPPIGLRAGFVSEADGDLADTSPKPASAETEVNGRDRLDKNQTLAIGFDNRTGPESQSGWTSTIFPSPAPTQVTPDVNVYQHKKTLAQGMMDLALLSANANQMRYVLQTDGRHPYFYPALVMISMSLVYNVKQHEEMCKANKANNWTVIGIFLVTILNVFISSFGVVDQTTVTA